MKNVNYKTPTVDRMRFTRRELEVMEVMENALKNYISTMKNTYRLGVRKSPKKEKEISITVDLLRDVQTKMGVRHTY